MKKGENQEENKLEKMYKKMEGIKERRKARAEDLAEILSKESLEKIIEFKIKEYENDKNPYIYREAGMFIHYYATNNVINEVDRGNLREYLEKLEGISKNALM